MPAPILCYGEILWDFLPEGLFLGGAPANVAYHLARLGYDARLVSAVGSDILGQEALRRLRGWKLDTELITRATDLATGSVVAKLSAAGDAHYEITAHVAWDRIAVGRDALAVAAQAGGLVFGTLALRSAPNRADLERLLEVLPPSAIRVLDINLRAPHDDLDLARWLAPRATVLKLNSEEAARLAELGPKDFEGSEETLARTLFSRHGCPLIAITSGAQGAGLLRAGREWSWETGREIKVADTVGAGDGFLAKFIASLLTGDCSDADCLARACRHGEWIASQRGATPAYP